MSRRIAIVTPAGQDRASVFEATVAANASFDALSRATEGLSDHTAATLSHARNEDCQNRFQIWTSNLGAHHPRVDQRSADYRLRDAPEVEARIRELLWEMVELNQDLLVAISRPSFGEGIDLCEEISELQLSVGDVITSLFKVSILIRKAAKRDKYAKAAAAREPPLIAAFDIRHVADKHPKLYSNSWLLERLGTAITQRRQFLRYSRNHRNRVAHIAKPDIDESPLKIEDGQASSPNQPERKPGTSGKLLSSSSTAPSIRPTLSPTTASTLQPENITLGDELQDLDDRDDVASQSTSYTYSHADEEGSDHLRVARLDKLAEEGKPFECPYCFGIVRARHQRAWKKHVFSDLRAYVCFFQGCDAGLFEDKDSWMRHEVETHRRQWQCQSCNHRSFGSAADLHQHIYSLHGGNMLPADTLTQLVAFSSRPIAEASSDCLFCEDFDQEVRERAQQAGQAVSKQQCLVPLAEYQKHLAFHLEQLALFAIPPTIEKTQDSESRDGQVGTDHHNHFLGMEQWRDEVHDDLPPSGIEEITVNTVEHPTIEDLEEPIFYGSHTSESLNAREEGMTKPVSLRTPLRALPTIDEEGDEYRRKRQAILELKTSLSQRHSPGESHSVTRELFDKFFRGDIVYIEGNEEPIIPLKYIKGVYLGKSKDDKDMVRIWNTSEDIEVSLSSLVRKSSCGKKEMDDARLLLATAVGERPKSTLGRRFPYNFLILDSQEVVALDNKLKAVAKGYDLPFGYDEDLVVSIFSSFLDQFSQTFRGNPRHQAIFGDIVSDFEEHVSAAVVSYACLDSDGGSAVVQKHTGLVVELLYDVLSARSGMS